MKNNRKLIEEIPEWLYGLNISYDTHTTDMKMYARGVSIKEVDVNHSNGSVEFTLEDKLDGKQERLLLIQRTV